MKATDKLPTLSHVVADINAASSTQVGHVTLLVLHLLTYLPLALLPILQDAHLRLGVLLCTSLCVILLAGNAAFWMLGTVKVFPKTLDSLLLLLYAAVLVPLAFTRYRFLSDWVAVLHFGAASMFIWATVLLPCRDCFALEALKDHVPQHLWHLPAVKAAGLRISQAWGMATVGSALAALAPAALSQRATQHALHIVCDYVIVLLLLAAAAAVQWRVSARVLAAIKALQAGDTAAGVERWVQEQSASVRGGGIAAGEDVVCTLEQQPHPQQPRQQLGAPGAPAKPRLSTDSAASRQTAPCVVVHASDGPVGRPT